jgi:hypothetical protein
MRVELLHHLGCRSAPAALELVRECLTALAIPDPVLVRVGDYASPTVLVNGVDVMRPTAALSEANTCRIDVPTRDRILAALTAHSTAESPDTPSVESDLHESSACATSPSRARCRQQLPVGFQKSAEPATCDDRRSSRKG